nr:hypothetical protein [Pseudomonadales bacterium]
LTIWPRFDAGEVPSRALARAKRHAPPSWMVSFGHFFVSIFVAGALVKRAYVGSSGEGATVTPAHLPQTGKWVLGSTRDCPQRLVAHLLSRSPTLGSYMSRSVKETVSSLGNTFVSRKVSSIIHRSEPSVFSAQQILYPNSPPVKVNSLLSCEGF